MASRHASSSRADPNNPPRGVMAAEPPIMNSADHQTRTLSPDRKDRYRSSGRGGGFPITGFPATNPSFPNGGGGGYAPPPAAVDAIQNNLQQLHSNPNSYNQYNNNNNTAVQQQQMNPYGEVPPPRPTPPASSSLLPPAPVAVGQASPLKNNNLTGELGGSTHNNLQVAIRHIEHLRGSAYLPSFFKTIHIHCSLFIRIL